jgi:serine/threonine-protein kinase HipA
VGQGAAAVHGDAVRIPRVDHEKNHALGVSGFGAAPAGAARAGSGTPAQHYHLSPAFDVLPSGQALGYQQMRVGREGSESTLANAMSECRAFALTPPQAQRVAHDVAKVVDGWKQHFTACGVTKRDLALLAEQIDRPFLREQR